MKRSFRFALLFAAILLALFQPGGAQARLLAPNISSVTPTEIPSDLEVVLTITGSGFSNAGGTPTIWMGTQALTNVVFHSDTVLNATVPLGAAPGIYALEVHNPDGSSAVLNGAVTVLQGSTQWSVGDLFGGDISQVIAVPNHPGLVYAYSSNLAAVFRTNDGGENWALSGIQHARYLAVDPINPSHLYAGRFHSADGGATWTDMLAGAAWPGTDHNISWTSRVYTHPTVSGRVYLISARSYNMEYEVGGVTRSNDYGKTWTVLQNGIALADQDITALGFLPGDPGSVFAGTKTGAVYRSTDGGDHWTKLGQPLPSIGLVAPNPHNPNEIWLGTSGDFTGVPQFGKTDGNLNGYTPVTITNRANITPSEMHFTGAASSVISGGGWLFKTANGGATWQQIDPMVGRLRPSVALAPEDPNFQTIYAGDGQYGFQKSTDGGMNWQIKNQGMRGMTPHMLAVDPHNPARVFSVIARHNWPGIYHSENGGQSWEYIDLTKDFFQPMIDAVAYSKAGRLFVTFGDSRPYVIYSDDHGKTWSSPVVVDPSPAAPPGYFYMPFQIAASPTDPDVLLIAAVIGSHSIPFNEYYSEVYRSEDGGLTWTRANITQQVGKKVGVDSFGFSASSPNIVYADSIDFMRSTDGGKTWAITNSSHYGGGGATVDPVYPNQVLSGNMISTDGGVTWNGFNSPCEPRAFAWVPGASIVYGGQNGLCVSNDRGKTWQYTSGILSASTILSLAAVKTGSGYIIYAGASGAAVNPQSSPVFDYPTLRAAGPMLVEPGLYRRSVIQDKRVYLPCLGR